MPDESESGDVASNAKREILKGTLVQLAPAVSADDPQGLTKYGSVNQLSLTKGDTEAVTEYLRSGRMDPNAPQVSDSTLRVFRAMEQSLIPALRPTISAVAAIPFGELAQFAKGLVEVRTSRTRSMIDPQATIAGEARQLTLLNAAVVATTNLEHARGVQPIGMLNLERLEMAPAGIERGELIATIPLAPGEETAVVQKEWSVTSKEFTTIVTDSLEETSETGVTDNTDLSQATSSQNQHAMQFNITGTVQGGIPIVSGSSTTGVSAQDSASASASASIKHASSITRKAASRSRQEHKTTISTKTVTGASETSTRILKNTGSHPVRVDYFSMMRKWRVTLYRFGLRLTYDVVVPEPGAAMRRAYMGLTKLRARQVPFTFPLRHSDINLDLLDDAGNIVAPGPWTRPRYQWWADHYGASVRPYPPQPTPIFANVQGAGALGWSYLHLEFEAPQGERIREMLISTQVGGNGGNPNVQVLGARYVHEWNALAPNLILVDQPVLAADGSPFMRGAAGRQKVTVFLHRTDQPAIALKILTELSTEAIEQWRAEVWTALYNAAQNKYYAEQQEIAERIAEIQRQLESVDTLTMRREESDEIMKCVLKFVLGPDFDFMPKEVESAFAADQVDLAYGVAFDDQSLAELGAQWTVLRQHQDMVRFINQAIEWENVVTFLYSYFWDVPKSWAFIRTLRHSDSTRQAFLRAGSARVVLTVRKGWEERWMSFAATGEIGPDAPNPSTGPYLSIAQEIAAYDDRNYPGIAPANPARAAVRLQESVYATSTDVLAPSPDSVAIRVTSSKGFVVGLRAVIDVEDERHIQEAPLILDIPDATTIVVEQLVHAHDGGVAPFSVLQPGEQGALIAEWNEYTPASGTDIAMTSNLATIV